MVKVVVDTSILIEYFRTEEGEWVKLVDLRENEKVELILSAVVVMELGAGKSASKKGVKRDMELLLSGIRMVAVDGVVAKKAGKIKRKGQMGAMDAIIAATAMEEGAQVATLNKKHFEKIEGLRVWGE